MKTKKRFIGFAVVAGFLLSLAGSAWAAYTKSAINMRENETPFEKAEVDATYNQTVKYIYASSSGSVTTAYFFLGSSSSSYANNGTAGPDSLDLGSGLSATVATSSNIASLTISGKPTSLGDISFKLWRSSAALTSKLTNVAYLDITISVKEAYSAPKGKPAFKTATKLADCEINDSFEYTIEVTANQSGVADIELGDLPEETESGINELTITETGDNKATLTGTPKSTGTFTIPIKAKWDETKSGGEVPEDETTANFTLKVTGIKPSITATAGGTEVESGGDLSAGFDVDGVDDEGTVVATTAMKDGGIVFTATGSKGNKFDITVSGLPTGMTATKGKVTKNEDETMSDLTATITGSPTKAGTYTIKVYGTNDDGKGDEVSYTLKVSSNPDLSSLKLSDVTWGTAYNATLTAKGLQTGEKVTWSIEDPEEGAKGNWLKTSDFGDDGTTGLTLDSETGKISGTWDKMDSDTEGVGVALGSAKDKTYNLKIKATLGKAEPTKTVTLKFKAAKPTIGTPKLDDSELDGAAEFDYDAEAAQELKVSAKGPGKVKLSASGYPKWMTVTSGTDEETKEPTLTITGTPTELASNASFTLTAENAAGKTTSTIRYSVTGTLYWDTTEEGAVDPTGEGTLPDGAYKKGEDITAEGSNLNVEALPGNAKADALGTITLCARPGPIQWKATGLPAGVTLTPDKKNGTIAYLSGKPTAVTTKLDDDGESKYTITATNTVTRKSLDPITKSIVVYDTPVITTKTLPALSTGKNYSAKLAVSNAQFNAKWTVGFGETEDEAKADTTGKITIGDGTLEFDSDTLTITGDSDINRVKNVYVYIKVENPAGEDEDTLSITVKGVAAKIDNVTFGDLADEESIEFTATGTQPITMTAYIDKAAAKSMFGVTDGTSIDLSDEDNVAKLVFAPNTGTSNVGARKKNVGKAPVNVKDGEGTEDNGTGQLSAADGLKAIYKNVPVTIAVINAGMTKPATKVFKINYTPNDYEKPSLTVNGTALEEDPDPIQGKAGEDVANYVITVEGTDPIDIKVSGAAKDTAEEGVKAAVSDKTITISGKYPADKESKTTITVTATNTSTKDKVSRKFTFVGALAPSITTAESGLKKEVEVGKSVNISLAAKGTKTLTWSVANDTLLPDGLMLDTEKGKISGTPTAPTVNDAGEYEPAVVPIKVENAAGDDTKDVTIGVKGKKATLKTKTVTIQKGDDLANELTAAALEVSGVDDTDTVKITPAETIVNKVSDGGEAETAKLTALGLTLAKDGTWTGPDLIATKGTSVKLAVENIGTITTGSVKIIIKDVPPEIECDDSASRINIEGSATGAVTKTYELSIKDGTVTGDTAVNWKISKKPSKIQATITPSKKTDDAIAGATATLTVTVPKGFKNNQKKDTANPVVDEETGKKTYHYTDEYLYTELTVTLTNNSTKDTGEMVFKFKVKPAEPTAKDMADFNVEPGEDPDDEDSEVENTNALPQNVTENKSEADEAEADERLIVGEARTADSLTASERAFLAENGYVIAAILPEVKATESDWYNMNVALAEEAPKGGELVWFAFPRNAEATEDDEAVFYDAEGAEITSVPEEHKAEVSAWLNEDVTYAPVIAVKVDNATGAKDTLNDADAGDVVTEDALKEAKE